MTIGLLRGLLVTLLLLGTAGSAFAVETVTLSPAQDSWINAASVLQSNGPATTLQVRNRTSNIKNTLAQFSLSSIPSDATIKTGTLNLVGTTNNGARTSGAYPLTQAWAETGVTWPKRDASNNWTTAGGTIGAQTASATTGSVGDDGTNQFGSDGNAGASNRPKLVVTSMRKVRDLTVTAGNAQAIGSNGVSVHAVLPVAGTAIALHRLLGHWSVEVSLDGRVMDREEFVLSVKH